jgi:Flp pilus assembly pilin Flp
MGVARPSSIGRRGILGRYIIPGRKPGIERFQERQMTRRLIAVGRLFSRAMRDERGGEVVEYALVLGLLGIGAFAFVQEFGVKIRAIWQRLDDALGKF